MQNFVAIHVVRQYKWGVFFKHNMTHHQVQHVKVARLEPLTRFQDLVLLGSFTFLNELLQERTIDTGMDTRLRVTPTINAQGDPMYRLVGKFMNDERLLKTRAITGQDNLDFLLACNVADRAFLMAGVPDIIMGQQFKDLLPLGERSGGQQRWTLETGVEVINQADSSTLYPLKLHMEKKHQYFYVRQVELYFPRAVCDAWFEETALFLRQGDAGIKSGTAVIADM